MERAEAPGTVANRIASAMQQRGVDISTLAHAADIGEPVLRERLLGESTFTWPELATVGGVLRIHPAELMAGAA
ncbi:hypothetical protein [Curtobacterium sp. UCD-KPL2560]|uniref:hypothetical protein n=1 Tax=Curtobacterium sp. UCD-KPL2560 TaxID=1885315 RepID=UPI00149570F9|nr:hypothetical protein [Curtobacterium sp. UCD-KPL2560]